MNDLAEKYRPKKLNDVAGQPKAVAILSGIVADGLGGCKLWITGKPGTGKTTCARILAERWAEPYEIQELDATRLTPARLATIEDGAIYGTMGGQGKAFIINEAHGLSGAATKQLLNWLDRLPQHVLVIFTTTNDGEGQLLMDGVDGGPLRSRCIPIRLTSQGIREPYAKRLHEIAQSEGMDLTIDQCKVLVKQTNGDMRAAIQLARTKHYERLAV